MEQNFEQLRKKLPYHYAKLISKGLDNIGSEQVRLVFSGQITNPDIVEKVYEEAIKLQKRLEKIELLKQEVENYK